MTEVGILNRPTLVFAVLSRRHGALAVGMCFEGRDVAARLRGHDVGRLNWTVGLRA
jgi:hypothetical protein